MRARTLREEEQWTLTDSGTIGSFDSLRVLSKATRRGPMDIPVYGILAGS